MKIETIHNNIELSYDFINDEELNIINSTDIIIDDTPKEGNSYHRGDFNIQLIPYYRRNVINYLKDNKKLNLTKWKLDNWVNKITTETNKNDHFHLDVSYLTFLTYLNDDFEGGEFLYKFEDNSEIYKIKPIRGMTLITNSKLFHKVDPVTSGVRYSMVTFINPLKKQIKTLI